MIDLLTLSIGVGLAVSLVFTELFGLAAGGMVVPGYIALHLTKPLDVALTLGAGFAAFAIVRALSSFIIIYGRRKMVLMILVGFLLGALGRTLVGGTISFLPNLGENPIGFIGFIIPGLIAVWIDRQGLIETFSALLTASVIVRLILILFVGLEVQS
jgi:poly-gamma-glutamate biosynthesis protein PgsC/CapC